MNIFQVPASARFKAVIPSIVLIVGLTLASAVYQWSSAQLEQTYQSALEREQRNAHDNVRNKIEAAEYGLESLKALFTVYPQLSRAEFAAFVASRDLPGKFLGVSNFAFIEHVRRDASDAFVAAMRADGAPQFTIREYFETEDEDLYVVKFVAPEPAIDALLGVNILEPSSRSLMLQAIDSGQTFLTSGTQLNQRMNLIGGLIYMPIYKSGTNPRSVAERRAALLGVAMATLDFPAFFSALPIGNLDLHVYINSAQNDGVAAPTLVFDADGDARYGIDPVSTQFEAYGQVVRLDLYDSPAFAARYANNTPALMAGGLFVLSLTLALLIHLQANRLSFTENLVRDKTVELRRMAMVAQSTSDAVVLYDQEGRIIWVNEGFSRVTGYSPAEAIGRTNLFLRSIKKADPQVLSKIAESLSNGTDCEVTVLNQAKSGSEFWSDSEIKPLHDTAGVLTGFMEIARDITERKATQFKLEEQAALLDLAQTAILVRNKDGQISYWNAGATRLYGWSADEAIGRITHELFETTFPQPLTEIENLLIENSFWKGELTHTCKDGSRVVADSSWGIQKDEQGNVLNILEVNTDITERTQAQAEMRKTWELLYGAIDALNEAFAIYDPQERLLYCNDRYKELFAPAAHLMVPGARFEHIVRTSAEAGLYADAAGRIDAFVNEILAAPRNSNSSSLVRLSSGRTLRIHQREMPDGSTVGFYIDITDLVSATESAQSASRAKSTFLANMSHEIRTPLNAILGLAFLLDQVDLDPHTHTMIRDIERAGKDLLNIITDVLDMAKIEAGQMLKEESAFDLQLILESVAMALGLAIGGKDIEAIISPLPAGVQTIMGDPTRLQQVLMNLVGNAAKFTQAGSIELRIELLGPTDEGERLRFSVHDTGIGIAPEQQSPVFEAFAQADASTTRRFGGTGLGLSISRQLVQLIGGEIGLNSTLGQGSEFWFTIPLKRIVQKRESSSDGDALEVLIVDDSDVALEAISAVTRGMGWQAKTYNTGAAALAQVLNGADAKGSDVVILDWKMPDMDGLAVARAIRANLPTSKCPIVLMATAHSLKDLAKEPGATLADTFLTKPVTASSLKHAVQRARQQTNESNPHSAEQTDLTLAGVRVLLVEDNQVNLKIAERVLKMHGAMVALAEDGQQAVDWLLAHPLEVDLVLMDLEMPVLNGTEATRLLRARHEFDDLPIVALTAHALTETRKEAMATGFTAYATKPFDVAWLVALIARLHRAPKASRA